MADRTVREILASIEATLVEQSKATEQYRSRMEARVNSHSARLDRLEHWRTFLAGAGAVSGYLLYQFWDKWERIKDVIPNAG